jgi:hypothetical protein
VPATDDDKITVNVDGKDVAIFDSRGLHVNFRGTQQRRECH